MTKEELAEKASSLVLTPEAQEKAERAKKLVEVIRARGVQTDDPRFAVHEAHHALYTKLTKPWTSDNIHAALMKKAGRGRGGQSRLVAFELDARAVEWVICDWLGTPYDLDKWADIVFWETLKNLRIQLPTGSEIADAIKARKDTLPVRLYANSIKGLIEPGVMAREVKKSDRRGSSPDRRQARRRTDDKRKAALRR